MDNLQISMEIDGDSEFVKMFAPLDIIGYIWIYNGYIMDFN